MRDKGRSCKPGRAASGEARASFKWVGACNRPRRYEAPLNWTSQLARIATVSVMSASRFVRQMEQEGYLECSGSQY